MKLTLSILLLSLHVASAAGKLQSPRGADLFSTPPRLYLMWSWEKPLPAADITFDVYKQTDATITWPTWPDAGRAPVVTLSTNWTFFTTADAPPVMFYVDRPHSFFRCVTRRISTGETSK